MKARALRLTAIAHGLRSLWNAALYPRVSLDFLSGALDPRVTFSRGSNATLIGSDGTLQYAPHNLLTYSEQFDNAVWIKAQSTITSNSVVAPDGTTTADKLVEDATLATHFTAQAYSNSNVTLTFSIYIKAAERSIVRLQLSNNSTGAASAFFDASNGTISSAASDGGDFTGSTATITAVGNGWYRCSLTTLKGAVNTTAWPYVALASTGTTTSYTGDGVSGIHVWGAQLNVGALQPYYSTTVKNLLGYTQEFDNAAWVKTNAAVATNLLTYSEQFDNAAWTKSNSFVQTNQIRNNTMQGAVAGTPGTMPTNWFTYPSAGTGITRTVTSVGVENGVAYVDLRFAGTPSDTAVWSVIFESAGVMTAATGQTWSGSFWLKLSAGTESNVTNPVMFFDETNGSTFVTGGSSPLVIGTTWSRVSASRLLSGGGTVNAVNLGARFSVTAGAAIDMTLRIGLPQLVQGAVAGDVVQTYGTARAVMYPAPDGSLTADTYIPDTNAGEHALIGLAPSQDLSITRTFSIYLKSNGLTSYNIYLRNNAQTIGIQGNVDFSAGTITASNYGSPSSVLTPTITPVGNGWFRCTVGGALSATTETLRVGLIRTFTGNSTDGLFVWGAQLVQSGAAETYQRTEATIRPIGYTAPDGSLTAKKLIPTAASADHYTTSNGGTAVSGTVYTLSVYAKSVGYNFIRLSFGNTAGGGYTFFNLSNGTVGATGSMLSSRIEAVGSGWYRCSVSRAAGATATLGADIYATSADNQFTWAGNGSDGVAIWGAQLSNSASLDPYVYNPAAAPSNTAYYGPRADYDPVTLAPKGWLIEEQRTNSIRNNTAQGTVAGTPGTAPTYWSVSFNTTTGIARSIVGTGVEDGIAYIDINLVGTASGAGSIDFAFEAANSIAATTGQVWGASLYWKLATGSLTGLSNPSFYTYEYDSAVGFVNAPNAGSPALPTTAPLRTQRFRGAATLSGGATTAFVRPLVKINIADGAAIDITLRIGMPQLELGAFATSAISTTTAAATRAADVLSITGANFSSWYNQTEGTVFAEFGPFGNGGPTKNFGVVHVDDGTSSNIIRLFAGSTVSPVFAVTAGTLTQAYLSSEVIAPTNISKIAGAYKTDSFARSVNGTVASTDSTGTVPVVNRMLLGSGTIGVGELNGHIRSFKYYPTRLSNETLQSLTASSTPAPWTPAQISTALWLDAADAGTITLNSGNVSQWNDKSGNGRNVSQATAASQPAYNTAAFNSKPALVFDGVNDGIRSTGQVFDPSNSNLFLAIEYRNAVKTLQSVVASDVSGSAPYLYLQADAGALKGYGGNYVSAGTYSLNQREITQISRLATGNIELYRSGTLAGSGAAGIATVNDGFTFGVLGTGTFGTFAAMAIAEAVVVSGVLTTGQRQLIEGYLAWKWGLQANLPAGHPYKNTPPTA